MPQSDRYLQSLKLWKSEVIEPHFLCLLILIIKRFQILAPKIKALGRRDNPASYPINYGGFLMDFGDDPH